MAEKGETSADDLSCLPPSEPNTLAVGKPIFLVSSPTTASHSPPTLASLAWPDLFFSAGRYRLQYTRPA